MHLDKRLLFSSSLPLSLSLSLAFSNFNFILTSKCLSSIQFYCYFDSYRGIIARMLCNVCVPTAIGALRIFWRFLDDSKRNKYGSKTKQNLRTATIERFPTAEYISTKPLNVKVVLYCALYSDPNSTYKPVHSNRQNSQTNICTDDTFWFCRYNESKVAM